MRILVLVCTVAVWLATSFGCCAATWAAYWLRHDNNVATSWGVCAAVCLFAGGAVVAFMADVWGD